MCPYTGSTDAPDVVYSFTPDMDMRINISLAGSSFDTKLYVYEDGVTPGAPYACNDDYGGTTQSYIGNLSIYAGSVYYIVVDGYGGYFGDYIIVVDRAPDPEGGEDCSNPLMIEEIPYSHSGTTTTYVDDCDITDSDGPDVIFEMTLNEDRYMEISLEGSSYDTKLAVFLTDCCTGAGTEYAYNDDYYDLQSAVIGNFVAGTYYVVVDGYNGASGDYALNIFDTERQILCTQDYIGPDDDWNFITTDAEFGYTDYEDFYCPDINNGK